VINKENLEIKKGQEEGKQRSEERKERWADIVWASSVLRHRSWRMEEVDGL
jgi:hypothetical protein